MDRTACVDLPALPLQILLRRHPDWIDQPAAVVDRDKPLGVIQCVNEKARAFRILPGMRYSAGLSLTRELRARAVSAAEIADVIELIERRLWSFTPRIESSAREPGVFWLDATGLLPLYSSLGVWASAIRDDLAEAGLRSVVAVGFSRFGSYAAARASKKNIVLRSEKHERSHLRAVPIERLRFDPGLRDTLRKLGIRTLGGFVDLPPAGIRERFGVEAHELHRMARGDARAPMEPKRRRDPAERSILFDHAETNVDRLLAIIGPALKSILVELSERHEALASIGFRLLLDDGSELQGKLTPAVPTLEASRLSTLIRLRMESLSLTSGAVELRLRADGARASRRQLELFDAAPRRDLEAVHRAFAKIRADLGNGAVVRARLHDAHLPEARFGWEPLERLAAAEPRAVAVRPLVRRFYSPALGLPPRARHEPDGWLIGRMADGPVDEVIGPHIVAGGWWTREISRAYHFVRTRSGRWLWIYHDEKRRRWFVHGEVE